MHRSLPAFLIAFSILVPASVGAQVHEVAPIGGDLSFAVLADGRLVVAWCADDGDSDGIFFRLLQADATPIGAAARVNETTAGAQRNPSVALLESGDFVVTWSEFRGLVARRFDSTGSAVAGDLVLDGSTTTVSENDVASTDGGFAVAWKDHQGLYLRRFDGDGMPLSTRQDLPTASAIDWLRPEIVRLTDGSYLVTWVRWYDDGTGTGGWLYQVEARRVDAAGVPMGDVFAVSSPTVSRQRSPGVVVTGNDEWLFSWRDNGAIRIRRFDTSGVALGPSFVVGSTAGVKFPTLASTSTPEGVLLVYTEGQVPPTSQVPLVTRAFDASGTPLGDSRRLHDPLLVPAGSIRASALAVSGGRPIAVWYNGSILARRIPRFEPSVEPAELFACAGSTREVTVSVEPRDIPPSLSDSVTLQAIDGAPITFAPSTFVPPGTSVGTLANISGPERQRLWIAVEDAGDRDEVGLVLQVRQAAPTLAPNLVRPVGDDQPVAPILFWNYQDFEDGDGFEVQIARDAGFTDLVAEESGVIRYNPGITSITFRPPLLDSEQTYFWRVRRSNVCGVGPWADTSFTTGADGILVDASGAEDGFVGELRPDWDVDVVSEAGDFAVASGKGIGSTGVFYVRTDLEIVGPGRADVEEFPALEDGCDPGYGPCPSELTLGGHPGAGDFLLVWEPVRAQQIEVDGSVVAAPVDLQIVDEFDVATSPFNGQRLVVGTVQTYSADELDVEGQRIAADGTLVGTPFLLSVDSIETQDEPSVAFDPASGEFVVAWTSQVSPGDDQDGWSVVARRFAADATPLGDDFQVNVTTAGYQRSPEIAPAPNGEFLVVWRSSESAGTDSDGWSVQGRRIGAAGPIGDEFQVNSLTPLDQWKPSVGFDPVSGNFLVAWRSGSSEGTDQDSWSIQARYFGPDLQPLGPDFQVNTAVAGPQYEPKVRVSSATGRFLVAWRDPTTIRHRWLPVEGAPLFSDGFESGDISAWTP